MRCGAQRPRRRKQREWGGESEGGQESKTLGAVGQDTESTSGFGMGNNTQHIKNIK